MVGWHEYQPRMAIGYNLKQNIPHDQYVKFFYCIKTYNTKIISIDWIKKRWRKRKRVETLKVKVKTDLVDFKYEQEISRILKAIIPLSH